jgi:predicted HTH transcriptional regulator
MTLDAAAIHQLIAEAQSESLHLEFKTLSDPSGARITKDDRRMIAKALCGFSNADGGVLILGIETKKVDGLDVATNLAPIENASRFASLLTAALPNCV